MTRIRKYMLGTLAVLVLPFGLGLAKDPPGESNDRHYHWYDAPRYSAGIAPDPVRNAAVPIVQVYAAQTFGWRGYFAVHTWIMYKRSGDTAYTRYDVVGWGSGDVVHRDFMAPDGYWFGSQPQLLADHRGEGVEAMIADIEAAIDDYPYRYQYRSYPGPNSNTFIAHIGRRVPALSLDLPANAIGKDYRPLTRPLGVSSSGLGLQVNLLGLLGVTLGLEEGIEFNVFGLNFGIDFNRPALRLPSIGRLGMENVSGASLAPASDKPDSLS